MRNLALRNKKKTLNIIYHTFDEKPLNIMLEKHFQVLNSDCATDLSKMQWLFILNLKNVKRYSL